MPFAPLTLDEQKRFPQPCRDPQHDPPNMMVVTYPIKWVCPSCGASVILQPSIARMSCSAPDRGFVTNSRTKAEVEWQRANNPGGAGCCERYGNMMACDCLENSTICPECSGSGYAVHPENGWNKNHLRCSRGCAVQCSICRNPNCDNPNGQH